MSQRFITIWFRHLKTDWFTLRQPFLKRSPFVITSPDHGRMVITAANDLAKAQGIDTGMVLADARALIPSLQVMDDKPGLSEKLLMALAEWCIRYTPSVATDPPDGLILDARGCAHLWGNETKYLKDITTRLKNSGYHVRAAMADTIGAAWAMSRYGQDPLIIGNGSQSSAILSLPPESLRIDTNISQRLRKLGLLHVRDFISMPRTTLRRRFGDTLIQRLEQSLGHQEETIVPVQPLEPYRERLPCLEPIVTSSGIEIALQRLLETICLRLQQEQKGLRIALFKAYRVDGKTETLRIGTHRPSHNIKHLFKLFEIKLSTIEPALGIELFTLEAGKIEDISPAQQKFWDPASGLDDTGLSELMDRLAGKIGTNAIYRYVPDEHYWPERSMKPGSSLTEKTNSDWRVDRPRPMQLLTKPELIEVTAPIPDYPPMNFRHKGKLHKIAKADGPERIEQEWWLQQGSHRDYYCVEDEEGLRYWLFRLGHYDEEKTYQWFIHGFFA